MYLFDSKIRENIRLREKNSKKMYEIYIKKLKFSIALDSSR